MSKLTLQDLSKIMRDIDVCMMTTKTSTGGLESRPMSNNRDVDYAGDSYFFADINGSAAQEIAAHAEVNLAYSAQPLLGKNNYISITGTAGLIRDKEMLRQHWVKDVALWFKDGLDSPNIVLIHVKASSIKYWHGWESSDITL